MQLKLRRRKNQQVSQGNVILRVDKSMKPPHMPQFRPMKDFFLTSGTRFYDKNLPGSDVSRPCHQFYLSI
jgi:hypothetical protein